MPARAATTARRAASQASAGAPVTGKIASMPSPMNFSTSPPKACTAPATRSNQASRAAIIAAGSVALGQGGEVAQVRKEQHGADGLSGAAALRAGLHPGSTAPAEIGLEQRRQRCPRGQGGQGRRDEAHDLTQSAGLCGFERPRPGPAQHRTVWRRANRVLLHWAKPGQPVAPGWAEWPAGEVQRLDHRPGLRSPKPGAAGNDRMWHRERQRAAGQRQTVGQQPAAELGQEPVRARRGAGLVHQPGERRGQIHAAIMRPLPLACHPRRESAEGSHSLASAAAPGIRARVAPGGNLGQPVEIMGPAFLVAGALLGIGQAGVREAQQRSGRLLDQVDLD